MRRTPTTQECRSRSWTTVVSVDDFSNYSQPSLSPSSSLDFHVFQLNIKSIDVKLPQVHLTSHLIFVKWFQRFQWNLNKANRSTTWIYLFVLFLLFLLYIYVKSIVNILLYSFALPRFISTFYLVLDYISRLLQFQTYLISYHLIIYSFVYDDKNLPLSKRNVWNLRERFVGR